MTPLEAEFKAFLEDTLTMSLDEFLSSLNVSDTMAERLGTMTREEVEDLLNSLTPKARAGLLSFARHALGSAGIEQLRKRASAQKKTEEIVSTEIVAANLERDAALAGRMDQRLPADGTNPWDLASLVRELKSEVRDGR